MNYLPLSDLYHKQELAINYSKQTLIPTNSAKGITSIITHRGENTKLLIGYFGAFFNHRSYTTLATS